MKKEAITKADRYLSSQRRDILGKSAGVAVVLSLVALVFGWRYAVGVLAGSAVMLANFWTLWNISDAILYEAALAQSEKTSKSRVVWYAMGYVARLLLLLVLMTLLLYYLDPIGVSVGMSVLLPGIFWYAIANSKKS